MKKCISITALIILCANYLFAQIGNIVVPNGHALKVNMISLDKQGKYLYTIEEKKTIMWDAKTHIQLYTFPAGCDMYENFAISKDGTKIAFNNGNYGVDCFSTVSGKLIKNIPRKGSPLNNIYFSADGSHIYIGVHEYKSNIGDAEDIVSIDIASLNEEVLLTVACPQFSGCPHFDIIDDESLIIVSSDGWIVFNTEQNKIVFEYKSETGLQSAYYLPNHQCIVSYTDDGKQLFDIYTGKIKGVFPSGEIIHSVDNMDFIERNIPDGEGEYSEERTEIVYSGETFKPIREIKRKKYYAEKYLFSGLTNSYYYTDYRDVLAINTKTSESNGKFKRLVASLGATELFSLMDYDYSSGVFNIMTDDSIYKSINLTRLKMLKHKLLNEKYVQMFASTSTGDTIAVFSENNGYIKNIASGKVIRPALKYTASNYVKKLCYFSKNGSYLFYTINEHPTSVNTLYKVELKTGITIKVLSFINSQIISLHPDKSMLAIVEHGYLYGENHERSAKIWDLTTGKIIFEKEIPINESCHFISISYDKKNVLLVHENFTEIYEISTGMLLSKSSQYGGMEIEFYDRGSYGVYACTSDLSLLFQCRSSGSITALNTKGETVYEIQAHDIDILRTFFSADNKIMFTVSNDQSIKFWEARTGKLYGTLYVFNDGNDFVFITPDGRFDGTDGGIKRMYYFQNRNKIALEVVYERFYTPNLYQRLLNGEIFDPIEITINPSPLAKISYEQKNRNLSVEEDGIPSYINTTGLAEITVNATAENDKIDEIRLFHNGKNVNLATRGLFVTDDASGTDSKKYTINLMSGQNSFRAIALNSQRTESKPDEIIVNFQSGSVPTNTKPNTTTTGGIIDKIDKNATLHLIVIGINQYLNQSMVLNYALADASAFKDEMEKDAKSVITNVKTYFVTDNTATKSGITAAFAQVQETAKAQDVFVFYYAGHGVIGKDKEFYLVPNDVSDLKNVQAELESKGIPAKQLQQFAIDIAAQKQLFILDACQSAGAFNEMLSADGDQQKSIAVVSRSTGTHWMAASGAQQYANEFSQLGHGAFTYVLLEALKGSAAADKMITVNGLKNYLQQGVPELMKKYSGTLQYPASYGFGNDFPVEIIR